MIRNTLNRRSLLAGLASCALPLRLAFGVEGLPPLSTPSVRRLVYDLSWIGIPVGRHEIVVEPDGADGDFTVTNRVEIAIELLFVDVIRFVHDSTETWRGGRLDRLASDTEDDGEFHRVRGEATAEGFALAGSRGASVAPADVMTNNGVWVRPVPGRRPFINAKNGEVVDTTIAQPEAGHVRRSGVLVVADRFDMASPVAEGSLFYDGDLFVGGWFTRRGRTVDYTLADP